MLYGGAANSGILHGHNQVDLLIHDWWLEGRTDGSVRGTVSNSLPGLTTIHVPSSRKTDEKGQQQGLHTFSGQKEKRQASCNTVWNLFKCHIRIQFH